MDFHKEYSKKKDERSLEKLWIIISTLAHWVSNGEVEGPRGGIDDGVRVVGVAELVGRAFISMLHLLDLAGQLKADSDFRDLSLVMSLYLSWSREQMALSEIVGDLDDDYDGDQWDERVVLYAKKGGLDLVANGCCGTESRLNAVNEEFEANERSKTLKPSKTADRWKWSKTFKDFKSEHGIFTSRCVPPGAPDWDIMKWPRELRARFNFDGVDPLAKFSDAELKSGNLVLG